MDPRVEEAMRLLKEAGRLDLLAEGGACRVRPAWQAASGVAAAVAVCSAPQKSGGRRAPQVRSIGSGRGRTGSVWAAYGLSRRPGPLRAQPLVEFHEGGAGGGSRVVPAAAPEKKGMLLRGPRALGARPPKRGLPAGASQERSAGWRFPEKGRGAERAGGAKPVSAQLTRGKGITQASGRQVGEDEDTLPEEEGRGAMMGGGEGDEGSSQEGNGEGLHI
ncbi:hypothetical protein NDU88_007126 [Pleurodeles waltl]|uniref:Uncharacterized protein n=1 Tax=Pleurodeles waltl TaxID=8319 RepID=A0AAV7SRH8_PLEWA|nr:hypothetical protein NDU88_007126 [Pleurodeles waltl]